MEFLNNYTMQSVYFCNLKRELGCILACVDVIGEEETGHKSCHPEFISGSYQRKVITSNVNTALRQIYTFLTGKILWRNQTFFTKSKISEKAVKQVQNDIKGMANLVGWGFHPNNGGVECQ